MTRLFSNVILVVLLFVPSRAIADPVVVFDTFGPGGTYSRGGGPILGPGAPLSEGDVTPGQWLASSFLVPSGTFRFSGIDLALSVLHPFGTPTPTVQVTLWLVPDAGGLPGNHIVDTLAATAVASLSANGSIVSASSTSNPVLSGGLQYWLVASVAGFAERAVWMASFTDNRPLPGAHRRVDGAWSRHWPNGAFRVHAQPADAAPIPEPATLLLVGGGLAAVAGLRRRRAARLR